MVKLCELKLWPTEGSLAGTQQDCFMKLSLATTVGAAAN